MTRPVRTARRDVTIAPPAASHRGADQLPRGGRARAGRIFAGWFVVAGAFLVLAVGYGAAYSFAAFAPALESEFAASHETVSLVYSLCGCTAFGFSAISGPLADRVSSRVLAGAGMLLVGLGLWLSAFAESLTQILLSYGVLIGLGIGCAYVPAVTAVQRWFTVRRGLASGIAATGIGLGTALAPPAVQALIALSGWRHAFAIAGAVAVPVGLLGALLLAHSPAESGLRADGGPATAAAAPTEFRKRVATGRIAGPVLREARFALLYLGCFAVSVAVSIPFAYLPASGHARGLAWNNALALLSLIGVGSIAGRFLLGSLSDRLGRNATFLACCSGVAATIAWWAVSDGPGTLSFFALTFGATYGGFVALLPAFVADLYGAEATGSVLGLLFTSRALALLVGPSLAMVDAATFLASCALAGAVGTVLLALAARPIAGKSPPPGRPARAGAGR